MAGPSVIILSSSPATAPCRPQARHEPSPAVPTVNANVPLPGVLPAAGHVSSHDDDESRATKPRTPLRTGSNAAPIPENAFSSFTSAASIWRSALASSGFTGPPEEIEDGTGETTASRPRDPAGRTASLSVGCIEPIRPEKAASKRSRAKAAVADARVGALEKAEIPAIPATTAKPAAGLATDALPDVAAPAKPAKRARQTKTTASKEQTKIPNGRVTKSDTRDKNNKDKQPRRSVETVSRHFSREGSAPKTRPPAKPIPIDEPIDLEPAVARRMDWTPPPADRPPARINTGSSPVGKEIFTQILGEAQPADRVDLFKSLHDTFSCKEDDDDSSRSRSREGSNAPTAAPGAVAEVLRKRKLVDAFASTHQTGVPTVEKSPTKTKAPKKKARTITELATAAYRVPSDDRASVGEQTQDSLLNYFSVQSSADKPNDADDEEMVPIAGANTRARKPATKATKPKAPPKKKAPSKKQLVLSPASARAQVSQQEFVFGTHSQLAAEEDPALLRELHEAMQASNQLDDVTEEVEQDDLDRVSSAAQGLVPRARVNRLWGAGARDENGGLLEVEFVDLCSSLSPTPSHVWLPDLVSSAVKGTEVQSSNTATGPLAAANIKDPGDLTEAPAAHSLGASRQLHSLRSTTDQPVAVDKLLFSDASDLSVLDLTQVDSVPATTHTFRSPTAKPTLLPANGNTVAAIHSSKFEAATDNGSVITSSFTSLDTDPPASNQEQHQQMQSSAHLEQSSRSSPPPSPPPPPSADEGPRMPSYELYTDARLAGAVSSYGFKAIKKRSAMIALLEQCWESKHRQPLNKQSTASLSTTAAPLAAAVKATTNKRKQTTKQTTAAMAGVSEPPASTNATAIRPSSAASASPSRVGRPRKASDAAPVTITTSPAKPRGRPRKDSEAGATTTAAKKTTKASTKNTTTSEAAAKPPGGESPAKHPKGRRKKDVSVPAAQVEIPISEDTATKTRKPGSKKVATLTVAPESEGPPTRRRRKVATAATARVATSHPAVVIEIPDSESDDPFASPPPPMSPPVVFEAPSSRLASKPGCTTSRRRGTRSRSPRVADDDDDGGLGSSESDAEAALAASDTEEVDAADLSLVASAAAPASDAQAAMSRAITQAVTTAPPSRDATQPSWHEKMLMYDPVVVEDLAAWLNGGELDRVGFDGEVSALEVKKWCASKSVCCMARETSRGTQRRRV